MSLWSRIGPDVRGDAPPASAANGNGKALGTSNGVGPSYDRRGADRRMDPSVARFAELAPADRPLPLGTRLLSALSSGLRGMAGLVRAPFRPTAGDESGERDGIDDGVYAVTRNTTYWFNREVFEVEREAQEQARAWAERGLPHPSTAAEPLPVEQSLAARCGEILRQWVERVRTQMQDVIEQAGQRVGERLVALRFGLRQLEAARLELGTKERALAELRDALRDKATPFGYHRLFGRTAGFLIVTGLVLVEFIANFPIFRLLLPMNASLATVARAQADQAADHGIWSGPYFFAHDLFLRPEAVLMSLTVVIILVLLGDTLGGSLRPLLALSGRDNPGAAIGIRTHRRQHAVRAVLSVVGAALAVSFLFYARAEIPQTAAQRYQADAVRVDSLRAARAAAAATGSTAIGAIDNDLTDAMTDLRLHEDDLAYARTVSRSNVPILYLNIALLLAAAVVGYSTSEEDLADRLTEDPRYVELRRSVEQLRRDVLEHRQRVREAAADVQVGIARVEHLAASRPLQEWRAKAERLAGVIPLFRAENARLRTLDPREIAAFRPEPRLELPTVDESPFREPAGFAAHVAEFAELKRELARSGIFNDDTQEEES